MKDISLNGFWQYRIGYGKEEPISVPFSRLPVGRSECVRVFDLTEEGERVFLKFDGITYFATVYLNGKVLGQMLPYAEYEFEITECVLPTDNELRVVLEDLDRAFGPSEGWQNFGGIIRDVHLIYRHPHYIKNVFFKNNLKNHYKNAEIEIEIDAELGKDSSYRISLWKDDECISAYEQSPSLAVRHTVEGISLWSPDTPTLYILRVELISNGEIEDIYTETVGFKSFTCDRHRFLLNGNPLFLKGVCKHEMVGDSGHCPSPEQIEADLRMIKGMGCNFVRLVHYPHCKATLEIADRLGLFVSEEPGLWWSDTSNEEISAGSREVLRRTILRDRNHVSIAFWLCFNECRFTERYLIESAAVCRENDPTRMVSGANCMTDEETLYYYNKCGFDFYTMHPYADTFDRATKSASLLHDKPLLFTEWGGYYVYNDPHKLLDFMKRMNRLYTKNSDEGALAGAFFWYFAEVNDFNRGTPACVDGVLREALVDKNRQHTAIYDAFCEGLSLIDPPFFFEPTKAMDDLSACKKLKAKNFTDARATVDRIMEDTKNKGVQRKRRIAKGPVLSSEHLLEEVPHAISKESSLVFEGCKATPKLSVIGLTSAVKGYPLGGAYGETVLTVTVTYTNGDQQTEELKNGIHLTTVFALNGSSRIHPVSEQSVHAATFGYDKNFEIYVMNRLDIETDPNSDIQAVAFQLKNDDYLPLIYDVFFE